MDLEDIAGTIAELKSFEEELVDEFLKGKIKPPIHFSGGNEEELIKIFKEIKPEDWICTTYRNHYHALLRGIPKNWIKTEIAEGKSMHLMNRDYKFITSALVGGTIPIAVGIAMGLKLKESPNKVWAFCGDMAAETGIFYESVKYAQKHGLPINFIIEDNGLSVNTPTQKVWGNETYSGKFLRYSYKPIFPHQGCGKEVGF